MGQTALGGWESVESVLGERFLQEPCEEVYSGQDKLGLRLPSLSTDATPRVKAGRANGRVKQWQRESARGLHLVLHSTVISRDQAVGHSLFGRLSLTRRLAHYPAGLLVSCTK